MRVPLMQGFPKQTLGSTEMRLSRFAIAPIIAPWGTAIKALRSPPFPPDEYAGGVIHDLHTARLDIQDGRISLHVRGKTTEIEGSRLLDRLPIQEFEGFRELVLVTKDGNVFIGDGYDDPLEDIQSELTKRVPVVTPDELAERERRRWPGDKVFVHDRGFRRDPVGRVALAATLFFAGLSGLIVWKTARWLGPETLPVALPFVAIVGGLLLACLCALKGWWSRHYRFRVLISPDFVIDQGVHNAAIHAPSAVPSPDSRLKPAS